MKRIVYYQGDEVVDVKNILTDVGDIAVAVLDGEEIMHIKFGNEDDDIQFVNVGRDYGVTCDEYIEACTNFSRVVAGSYVPVDGTATIRKTRGKIEARSVQDQKPFTCPRCGGNTYSIRNGIIKCDYCDTEFIQFDAGEVARNDMASATWNFPPIATSYERY